MKNLPRPIHIILLFCFVFTTVSYVSAQQKRTNTRKKQAVSSINNSSVRRNAQRYPIETDYDRFRDETSVRMFIGVGIGRLLFVSSYEGHNLTKKPYSFTLKYIEPTRGVIEYIVRANYYVLADDYRIKGTMRHDLIGNEHVFYDSMTYSDAEKIATAQSVEFQIGNREFALPKTQIKAIGDFLNQLNPEIRTSSDSKLQSNSVADFNEALKQFDEENISKEIEQLRKLNSTNKAIIQEAIKDMKTAVLTARISSDTEEIARVGSVALQSSMKALNILPEGAVKTSITGFNGNLYASFLLRGGLVSKKEIESIIIKFNLSKIPPEERAAKLLATADFTVDLIESITVKSGIVE